MFRGNLISVCMISILTMLVLSPFVLNSSKADNNQNSMLYFDQQDGFHFTDLINVSGSSSVPLNSVEITLWNVTSKGQYDLMNSSNSLFTVSPFESTSGMTNWLWTHEFRHHDESCTCLVRISLLEQTDLNSYGLTVYLGSENHRPVLMFASESDQTSQIILATEDVSLSYGVLMPPNLLPESNTLGPDILTSFSLCPAPFGICTDDYSSIIIEHELNQNELFITMETLAVNLPDGLYLAEFYIQSMSLKKSNYLSQYLALDRNPPNVTLSSVSELSESESLTVDLDVDDGYEGSAYTITWTVIEPDGELRAVSQDEILSDNRLSFSTAKQGVYQIFGLVRDTGGNFVNVQHNVSVTNVEPVLDLRYDGFKISNNQVITVKSTEQWCFSANETTDTINDIETLEFNWFVDGKSLLSGRSYLLSSDIDRDDWEQITLILTDNDGATSSITFDVVEQQVGTESSFNQFTIWSTLLLILIITFVILIRKKVLSNQESDFVRWSDNNRYDD